MVWSPDGESLLASQENGETSRAEIWKLPLADAHAKGKAQLIVSDPSTSPFTNCELGTLSSGNHLSRTITALALTHSRPVASELLFRSWFLRIPLPCYDSAKRNLLVLFTIERVCHGQALHDSSHACKLLIVKEMVGASGFEAPTSWSRRR